jgi:hypothetical protein
MSTRHILDLFIPTYLHSWCLTTYKNLYPAPPHGGYWLITDRPSSVNDTKYTAYTPHLLSGPLLGGAGDSGADDDGELRGDTSSLPYISRFSSFIFFQTETNHPGSDPPGVGSSGAARGLLVVPGPALLQRAQRRAKEELRSRPSLVRSLRNPRDQSSFLT